ncbi:hypothetical protein TIFTF001_035914 [Ficus carica]|uniref:Uncharacterized protein n=1 Tax=Ficus carica TaxID=3494 RepID=A0AA88JAK0_FICCA|nr:hypothetical protein TIFTF001_035875 [Ficus carica]GMN66827.1 hypothetical protein TIFTF001_035892 [Ficus carica]GMN66830.1 hypothetical protein TIFTF001_035897 [Ficus carica]GMN66849.1 hypothetical protein TIFTF001_035914 [Ficus carica]
MGIRFFPGNFITRPEFTLSSTPAVYPGQVVARVVVVDLDRSSLVTPECHLVGPLLSTPRRPALADGGALPQHSVRRLTPNA